MKRSRIIRCAASLLAVFAVSFLSLPVNADKSAEEIKDSLMDKAASLPETEKPGAESPSESAETEFVAPDTYPSIYATPYASETMSGLAYLEAEDGKSVSIEGYRGTDTAVRIPETIGGLPVTKISEAAFAGDGNVKSVEVPDSVTEIGAEAFSQMSALTSVTLPDSLSAIPDRLFYGSESLREVSLPSALVSIGSEAFAYCRYIRALKVPESVTEIGIDAFFGCESLTLDVSDNQTAAAYASQNGISAGFEGWPLVISVSVSAVVLLAVFIVSGMLRKRKKG